MEGVLSRWADPLRVAVGLLGVLCGVGALAVSLGPGRFTTYAAMSTVAAGVTFAVGTCLVVAGLVTALSGRAARAGDLSILVAFTWFAPVLVGWQEGPPFVRSMSEALSLFTVPLVLHLILVHPSWRPHRVLERVLMVLVYLEAAAVAVTLALFRDPFFDPTCFANCSVNTFLIHSSPTLVQAVEVAHLWFGAGLGVLLASIGAVRILTTSSATRRRLLPVALPAVLVGCVVTSHAVVVASHRVEDPSDRVLSALYLAACLTLVLLAAGLVSILVRAEWEKRVVARIVAELHEVPAPGDVEAALQGAMGDADLHVAYWLTDTRQYVDANGRPVPQPLTGAGRTITSLTWNHRTMAAISQSGADPYLADRLGPSVRLGLENERLQAGVLAQLEVLRRSRTRIVEAGDVERQRLERNLHDGAQQRLLALSYDIRLARAAAEADGDDVTATALRQATQATQQALEEVRDLARGIFPAPLAELGLAAALETLADLAPLPVQVRFTDDPQAPTPVETAAYFAVAEAVQDAALRSANHVEVLGSRISGRLVISIHDDGTAREAGMMTLTDRIGALGGHVLVDATSCRMEIPCG